jgi:hypothetical protein
MAAVPWSPPTITPSLGTVHEWSTSAVVIISGIGEFIGSTTRLSVSGSEESISMLIFLLYMVAQKERMFFKSVVTACDFFLWGYLKSKV